MTFFLLADVGFLLLALLVIGFVRTQFLINRLANLALVLAMVFGLCFTVSAFLLPNPPELTLFSQVSLGNFSFRFDKLSLFFLGIIQVGGIVTALYGTGYLSGYEKSRSLRSTLTATILLFLAMQILITANHTFLFLVAWELMALSGYLGIVFEREKEDVQQGSLIFFAATHIGTLFLYLMFILLHNQTGSWEFTSFQNAHLPSTLATTIFWFGFIGFGMKAGFMPFHFWLPEAHPVAPSHISAVLSAVMLKTGIYGLIRVISWNPPTDYVIPSILLTISVLTAIFGIWNALAQKDLKRMLAYSSIENIGIIGIALSLMIFGIQNDQPLVIFLGLTGALFHSANHFLFKSLLFMCAGTIYHFYHHRNIEKMGGLLKSAPTLGIIVLVGSVAISGLPPLNGFASEFIIFSGFFEASKLVHSYFPFFMLIGAVALAFTGGLALIAFSKVFSVIFLGNARQPVTHDFHPDKFEFSAFFILVGLILITGLFPQTMVGLCLSVYSDLFHLAGPVSSLTTVGRIQNVSLIAVSLFVVTGILLYLKNRFSLKRKSRISPAWGCGYPAQTSRMQYSSTSFSDEMINIAGEVLNVSKEKQEPESSLPKHGSFKTVVSDLVLNRLIFPANTGLLWTIDKFKWLQSGKIQVYVTFSVATLIFYLFLAYKI